MDLSAWRSEKIFTKLKDYSHDTILFYNYFEITSYLIEISITILSFYESLAKVTKLLVKTFKRG